MSFNGSGTFQLNSGGLPVVTGTTISSTVANNLNTDLATGLSTAVCKDGQTTITANLPMAGFKHTGVAVAANLTDYARADQTQNCGMTTLASVAGTNTITGSATPTPSAYASGQEFSFTPAATNTAATTININSLGAKNIFFNGAALSGGELVVSVPAQIKYDGTQFNLLASCIVPALGICEGRLTLTTAVPVTTADVTAAETVYWTPYKGARVALYDGTRWKMYAFTELSVDVPDATQMNDVFIYDNAGTLALEVLAWTNVTTRATALATQNGVLVKTGATARRYIGSFYSTTAGNGQTEDSIANRYLWNYYNRVVRPMSVLEATDSWTYTTATIRQTNGSTANQLNFVIGVSEDTVWAQATGTMSNTSLLVQMDTIIGLDSTSAMAANCINTHNISAVASTLLSNTAFWRGFPGVGKHYISWLEYSAATGTSTWYGDGGAPTVLQSGINGEIWA